MWRFRTETEPKPWIEQLIQSYGKEARARSVRGHVVGVSDLTESQRTDEEDACMLFLSDGTVFIPAVLSAAAWEYMQELEERDTFSGLENTTVSVREFQLKFHMDPELVSCQFYLSVNQIVTVGQVSRHYRPPSCTLLPSVREQILKTWRSLMPEDSDSSLNSSAGLSLTWLLVEMQKDFVMDLLNDAIKKIAAPTAGHRGVATPTLWHQERLRCRSEECFSTPVSHLLIPQEQREMLTADPGVSSLSGLVPPHEAEPLKQPITAQDRGGDFPAPASYRPVNRHQLSLDITRPEVWCGGRASGERESPWDKFCSAADLLATPSSCSECNVEPLSQPDTRSLFPISGSAEESVIAVPPFQRPRPSPCSPAFQSDSATADQHQEQHQEQSPLTTSKHTAAECLEEQSPTDSPQNTPHPVSHTPPAKKTRVHSDGSRFSYTYEPCPKVASALSCYKVPDHLVQWAVAYLGTPQCSLSDSTGVELTKAAVWK